MSLQPLLRPGVFILMGLALLPAAPASARDRIRIPLPPPPGEVIRDVRGFIHGIGRGIRRAGERIVNEAEEAERPSRKESDRREKWDGEFYPDELDTPDMHRQYRRPGPPRDDSEFWQREDRLRREQESREAARNYRPSDPQFTPTTPPPPSRTEVPRTPALPPPPNATGKGSVKESSPAPTVPKTSVPSDVPYASPVPGKKGLVYPPGAEKKTENMVDVADFQPGQLVRNPRTGELFRVP